MLKTMLLAGAAALALACATLPATAQDIKPGGTMTVTYKDDVTTLDPAIGYDWQNWSIIKSIFGGLMDYKPGTTELEPELAESFTVSPDGLTYTFKLRQGVKFQNGRAMKAADVKYSIERAVQPETQSPGAGFYDSIDGYADVSGGKAKELKGIETPDDATVVFHLNRPDAPFLHKLALNFAHVVPKEEVEKWGTDFGKHPVGTGAFKLAEWTLGQRIVLERNPDYFRKGLPHLDKIVFEVGQEPVVALLRLQRGEVDILGDGIPPAKFLEVMQDPTYKGLIIQGSQLHTGYVTMNVKAKPFDDVRVRQAVNMAINKDRVIRIINGRAKPANQPLPPGIGGYDPDYKGYAYDVDGAKKLMAEAGQADGFTTTLYASNTDPQPRIAQAIQQDLAQIGIKAEIKALAQANVIAAGGDEAQSTMIWSGGMAWIADYPDPSDFYGPILGCGGAVPGGWNWSWYCNPDLEKQAAAADAMADPAQAKERDAKWQGIFEAIMKDAPWAPVFNQQQYTLRSARIGGDDSLFVDPVHIPINFDNVYAKDVQ